MRTTPPKPVSIGNARRRVARKVLAPIEMPELPPHHHSHACSCEPTKPYVRISKRGQRDHIVSPQVQVDEIVKASIKENLRLVGPIYYDERTGKSLDGRKVPRIVDDIKRGDYRKVAVWNWSRWGRNTLESLHMCNEVDEAGGYVVSATEAFDTTTPTGEFIRSLLLAQAQWQSRLIGEGWKSAQRLRREGGLPHGGRERFGYVYGDRTYVVDQEEAQVLTDAYERLVGRTATFQQITDEWNDRGIVTTMGGPWTRSGLQQMLDTGFAAGFIRERSNTKDKPTRNNFRAFDVWRTGSHEAIISIELWNSYMALREGSRLEPHRVRVYAKYELSRLLFCSACTRRMTTHQTGTTKTHQWRCANRKPEHSDGINIMVANSIALRAVREWVAAFIAKHDRSDAVTDLAREHAAKRLRVQRDSQRLDAMLAKVRVRKDRLRNLYTSGVDPELATPAQYKDALDPLLNEERRVRGELAQAKASGQKADLTRLLPAFKELDEIWNSDDPVPTDQLNMLLSQVIGMVVVGPPTSRRRSESASRLTIVPAWEMDEWESWFAAKRRRNLSA